MSLDNCVTWVSRIGSMPLAATAKSRPARRNSICPRKVGATETPGNAASACMISPALAIPRTGSRGKIRLTLTAPAGCNITSGCGAGNRTSSVMVTCGLVSISWLKKNA